MMARIAVLENGVVTNVVVADPSWRPTTGTTMVLPDGSPVGPGYLFDGDTWTAPTVPLSWDEIRVQRDAKLTASDWTQVADAPVDAAAWAAYRQQLRDVPQDFATPDEVVWPTPPA